ncbi:MAG: cation diffusion facilitator family transporter [candidate division KSB1 bacterium]|nr:cation diffusion facilitator family transporter [candidate division KSB1 bacterium]MDZ7304546.1 cation diffusion facilitator family transporter [candidate division KSB1 bacterium]MDZ7313715.1 cation diffusion facilitator family transporter [candidate division KSB1 bacterium]
MSKNRILYLSIAAALITMVMKFAAYWITGSVGLLSDALESIVNLVAALIAFAALSVAMRPADASHPYGHEKIEYFSSGVEGTLILVAAAGIIFSAVKRLLHPMPLADLDVGLLLGLAASATNFLVAQLLLRAARRYDSITIEADARHLLTDVWTTIGVLAALLVVKFTNWLIIDPLIAFAVGGNIIFSGIDLLRRSFHGLMDYRLPAEEIAVVEEVLRKHIGKQRVYHNLRTRKSGSQRFIEFHLLVPGTMSVSAAHDLCEQIENEIRQRLHNIIVTIHTEPADELISYQDAEVSLPYGK